jgi:hypothetical protein
LQTDDFTLREITNARIATRYSVSIPVTLRIRDKRVDARIVDISDSGAKLECASLGAGPHDTVQLELVWFDDERPSMLARFIRETDSGCGVQFTDPCPFLRLFVKLARLHDDRVLDCFRVVDSQRF